eukprot:Skav209962  [mRNA]  locus=scaffold2867:86334:87706:+ [translate_table: standard]
MDMYEERPPEIFTGGYFDQAANALRKRLAEDRPLLVMSFGLKYQGPNPSKYKIEGKYDIPVGFKALKTVDCSRIPTGTHGTFGPEFQIVYLPQSPTPEDFTVFEWNANIAEIWDQATVATSAEAISLLCSQSCFYFILSLLWVFFRDFPAVPDGHRGQGGPRHETLQSRTRSEQLQIEKCHMNLVNPLLGSVLMVRQKV